MTTLPTRARPRDDQPARCDVVAAEVTRRVVGRHAQLAGRGPTKAHTSISPDVITTVLSDGLTRLERTLIDHGHAHVVTRTRGVLAVVMRRELAGDIEAITGRTVTSVHVSYDVERDIAVVSVTTAAPCATGQRRPARGDIGRPAGLSA